MPERDAALTPERWKRIEELYYAARARAPDDRTAFLAEACPDDEAMRRDVESLLKEPGSDDGFLAKPLLVIPEHMVAGAAVPREAMAGRSLGGYHLQALLGEGGMGEVYRAHDSKLGRDVAIKVLPAVFTGSPDRLARFEREARMLAALNHPNICGIYGVDEADGIRLLVLELVEGETLAARLKHSATLQATGEGLPLRDALGIARQVADALEAAHEKGIVHRDLKPANIKITPDGVVKVLDFGLAKAVAGDGSSPDLTHAPKSTPGEQRRGAVIGTAAYMSPEQARGLPVDKRTDIWAFGCVLYEMLTGRVAFPGETASDSIAKVLEREPDWSPLPATTPTSIRRLLLRCLMKDPKRRLRDIGDVRIEINAVDEVIPGTSDEVAPRAAATPVMRWLPWVALVALAAGVVIREAKGPVTSNGDHLVDIDSTWEYEKLTNWPGAEWAADISPDSKTVAFLADREGEVDLFDVPVNGESEPRNRTSNLSSLQVPEILRPFGYHTDGLKIWLSDIFDTQKWLLTPDGKRQDFLSIKQQAPSWNSHGDRLVFFKQAPNDSLFVSEPGDPTPSSAKELTLHEIGATANKDVHRHNPVFSLDGQSIYYVRGTVRVFNQNDEMDIWVVSLSTLEARKVTSLNAAITSLAVYDDRTLLFVARDGDRSGPWLYIHDVPSGMTQRALPYRVSSVAISRNRERGVITRVDPIPTLWTAPIPEGDEQADEGSARPYEVGTDRRALAPRYGPDKLLYFLSGRNQHNGLWSFKDGLLEEKKSGAEWKLFEPPVPCPDGRVGVIRKSREGKYRLTFESALESLDVYGTADCSPNGKEIAAGGVDVTSVRGLYRIPLTGPDQGKAVRLKAGVFSNPVYAPNGEFMVYSGPFSGQSDLLAIRSDGQDHTLVAAVGQPVPLGKPVKPGPLRVSPGGYRFRDDRHIIYLPRPESSDFWEYDLVTGHTRQITRLQIKGNLQNFDIIPGEKRIIFERTLQNADIEVINFHRRAK